jgi:4-hydroxybenzoate polyprenyltransferase
MNRWLIFFTERFPLVNSAALVTGISLSGIILSGLSFHILPFILSFIGIVFMLALVRLMDDVKNIEKDRIAHSNRPLPRGLITRHEAVLVIETMEMILFAYGLLLWVILGPTSAISYLVVVAYFWLMNKDFKAREWLSRHPLISGLLNQLIAIPIAFFAVSVMEPQAPFSAKTWSFALVLFGAFFCYDICSKLSPHAHPVLGTYIHFYGYRFVFNMAVVALAISAMGAIQLGVAPILIPVEFVVLAGLSTLFFQPLLYRLPHILAGLSLMIHAWAIVIHYSLA